MTRLGRADDPAPYTVDLRAPRRVSDRLGQKHFDKHGFFFSPGRIVANQPPNALPPGSESGRFSFDNRPLTLAESEVGVALQLMDGLDGGPLTRAKLAGGELEFCGRPRGFTIRIRGASVSDPAFRPQLTIRTADLSDLLQPRHPGGAPMTLAPTDLAVDPQLGRFILDLAALAAKAEDIRVDYLLAPAALSHNNDVIVVAELGQVPLPALLVILAGADQVVARGVVFQAGEAGDGGGGAQEERDDQHEPGAGADGGHERQQEAADGRGRFGHPVVPWPH